ncbi:MAG: hypothetical protein HY692_00645, partial [Cyanobacteria bacterium NC_groundwater_1444_Ag_S-0.65um_54_12]|nr:hypothetical protein [Cyanobacteria bacterium NC_groundwater_1444_Ag_S-0.65um_54_12]
AYPDLPDIATLHIVHALAGVHEKHDFLSASRLGSKADKEKILDALSGALTNISTQTAGDDKHQRDPNVAYIHNLAVATLDAARLYRSSTVMSAPFLPSSAIRAEFESTDAKIYSNLRATLREIQWLTAEIPSQIPVSLNKLDYSLATAGATLNLAAVELRSIKEKDLQSALELAAKLRQKAQKLSFLEKIQTLYIEPWALYSRAAALTMKVSSIRTYSLATEQSNFDKLARQVYEFSLAAANQTTVQEAQQVEHSATTLGNRLAELTRRASKAFDTAQQVKVALIDE